MDPKLVPLSTKPNSSVARVLDDWYVVARSDEVKRAPLARTLMGIPMVIFRGDDGVGALVDRCPHRNAPLSAGRVVGATVQCGYHGWRFDPAGRCQEVPGLEGESGTKAVS